MEEQTSLDQTKRFWPRYIPKNKTNSIPRRDLRPRFHVLNEQLLGLKDRRIAWVQSAKPEEFDLRQKLFNGMGPGYVWLCMHVFQQSSTISVAGSSA